MKKLLQKFRLYPDTLDGKAVLISFLIINFAFLFHTLNFMWGNHDVKFIKEELLFSSGLFEGRFTQFIPYRLLTGGQILPLLNNLLGFAFLTAALWLLAKYWNIKKSLAGYIVFISFFATQPYTLSWMYFTFITISCMLWAFLAALGLYLSGWVCAVRHKILLCLGSVACFYLALGGYPPVINMFFVCLGGRLVIAYVFEQKTLKDLFAVYKYTLLNILIAAVLFKLTLKIIAPGNVYNLETEPLSNLPLKFFTVIKIAFGQFWITVPFMERGYKIILALMSFCAVTGIPLYTPNWRRRTVAAVLICGTVWATALTTFLVVPHTEFVSRIDFYGFAFLYAFFLGLLLTIPAKLSSSLAAAFAVVLLPLNILNDYTALKVWKQGFDAEMQILDNISERIENHPDFSPDGQYRFYQAGDISLRPNYYRGSYDKDDVFLLSLPYLAMWQGANLLEFYSPFDYIDRTLPLLPDDITPDVYDFFMNQARPWPHPNSVYVNSDIIIVVYNQAGLEDFRRRLQMLPKP